jgi:ribosomal protein L28
MKVGGRWPDASRTSFCGKTPRPEESLAHQKRTLIFSQQRPQTKTRFGVNFQGTYFITLTADYPRQF